MTARAGLMWLAWGLVGIAKTVALVLVITSAETHWRQAAAALLLAFALAAVAVRLRES